MPIIGRSLSLLSASSNLGYEAATLDAEFAEVEESPLVATNPPAEQLRECTSDATCLDSCSALASFAFTEVGGRPLQVGGFSFQEAKEVNGAHRLRARGCSHLTHWGFQVCAAVLYLPEDAQAATGDDIMDPGVAKQLELRYLRRFTGDQFRITTRWSISRNGLLCGAAAAGLEQFNPLYQDVGPGDCYTLTYDPGSVRASRPSRVTLALNGVQLGSVEGAEFSRAIFSV
eukprot:CAMPEP_0115717222 /NCGR_PEP_ID=MMETSP0272-20121206/76752_1 /TAXON_ID=71861 /ORGANISM="Scrippsiella trochoidea, Strain CCMP3099" /LENGTH=229 /DNA_ID=CAMNT_0003159609 /DNA_START=13 /DNA_END=699 /DNA_ORIENTATION=+